MCALECTSRIDCAGVLCLCECNFVSEDVCEKKKCITRLRSSVVGAYPCMCTCEQKALLFLEVKETSLSMTDLTYLYHKIEQKNVSKIRRM